MARTIPDGYSSVTAYLIVKGADEALEFYKKALGAEERFRMPGPDGKLMHAEMRLGDSIVMVGEENPNLGAVGPKTLGGVGVSLHLYVNDVDTAFTKAVEAGCEAKIPPSDMFWGDRYSKVEDPFGHQWGIATHKEDLSPDEMNRRMVEAMVQ